MRFMGLMMIFLGLCYLVFPHFLSRILLRFQRGAHGSDFDEEDEKKMGSRYKYGGIVFISAGVAILLRAVLGR